MKRNNLKRVLVCSALAVSMPITATALTNPAGTGADVPPPDTKTTGTQGGTTNPATPTGQQEVKADTNKQNSTNNSVGGSSTTDGAKAPPKVENGDLKEAVEKCPLQESADKAMEDAIVLATTQPDVDTMFNTAKEAAQGCFAASSQVINLADLIPNVNTTGIGTATKKALTTIIDQQLNAMKEQVCAIADQALLSSLEPIRAYMDEYKKRVGEINGMVGNIGVMGEIDKSGTFGVIEGVIEGQIGSTAARLDEAGEKFSKAQAEIDRRTKANIDAASKKFEQEVEAQYKDKVAPVVESLPSTNSKSTPAGAKSTVSQQQQTFRSAPAPVASAPTTSSSSSFTSPQASPSSTTSSTTGQVNKFASSEEIKSRF